jgi:hypothetical protein
LKNGEAVKNWLGEKTRLTLGRVRPKSRFTETDGFTCFGSPLGLPSPICIGFGAQQSKLSLFAHMTWVMGYLLALAL